MGSTGGQPFGGDQRPPTAPISPATGRSPTLQIMSTLVRVVSGVERLISGGEVGIPRIVINSESDPNLVDQHIIRLVSTEVSSLEDSILEHNRSFSMALRADYQKLNDSLQETKDRIGEFATSDVVVSRLPVVDLDSIWNSVEQYRNDARKFLTKHQEELSETNVSKVETEVQQVIAQAKSHAIQIRDKAQELAPTKPMSEFEKASLQQQKLMLDMQNLALKEQQSYNKKVEGDKRSDGLARAKANYKKFMESCSQLAVDILPGEFDEWSLVSDDEVRKAIRSKEDWVRRITKVQNEFINYEILVDYDFGDYVEISIPIALVRRAVDNAVEEVEKEAVDRNLYALDKDSGTKLDYPQFSGKFSEDFLEFKDKMEKAFRANKVAKVDQVDKLSEQLKGFAKSLVPDNMRDIADAFKALSEQWGYSESYQTE